MAYFQGFEPTTPTGRLFWVDLGGSSLPKPITIMDLGFWVQMNPLNTFLPPLETSNGLKMALNWWFSALYTYWDAILAGSGWLLASKVYIHNGPWVLGPDLPLKHLHTTSGSLKKALHSTQITLKLIFKPTRMHFWVALGGSWPPKPISMIYLGFWVQIYPKNTFLPLLEASRRP